MKRVLIDALDESYGNEETWYGPNLRTTLQSLTIEQLVFDDTYEGYSAWELALHCAYWKWLPRVRLTGDTDEFPYLPLDFPRVSTDRTHEKWKKDFQYLDEQHRRLKAAVADLMDGELSSPWRSREGEEQDGSVSRMIMGVAFHDAYHTAQIRSMGLPGLVEAKR